MKIEELDQNLYVSTDIKEKDVVFFNAHTAPFSLYGILYDEKMGCYTRMPDAVAKEVSASVGGSLNRCTAGGRVRFVTDSPYIAIHAVMPDSHRMSHMPLTGQSGFDLYRDMEGRETYYRTFVPPVSMKGEYTSILYTDKKMHQYTINFPLYDGVKELYIGLKQGTEVKEPAPYLYEKPIVYYGSSITQGGCASRPGNSYEAILTRRLHADHINLGFSGSGKGESRMAEYIATLPMSIFVCDYDHNCKNNEHLRETHLPFYLKIREKNPTLPIVFVTAPCVLLKAKDGGALDNYPARRAIIRETYEYALAHGDPNVYFIDGAELYAGEEWDACTVDGTHPNDLGFYRMAMRMEKTLKPLLH